ncbi:MAG: hypothetical protein AAGJ09_03840 [Pseudomonadota bacterium]
MKIAGNSFAFLTQLGQDSARRAPLSSEKLAAQRAERIAIAREAQDAQVAAFRRDRIDIGTKNQGQRGQQRASASPQREAIGARPEKPARPGQVLNIVI